VIKKIVTGIYVRVDFMNQRYGTTEQAANWNMSEARQFIDNLKQHRYFDGLNPEIVEECHFRCSFCGEETETRPARTPTCCDDATAEATATRMLKGQPDGTTRP
jgi:hypothetical protein